jgi:hypothetical protein
MKSQYFRKIVTGDRDYQRRVPGAALKKCLLAYLYIIAVFLYTVRRGWPLSGWPPFFRLDFIFTVG